MKKVRPDTLVYSILLLHLLYQSLYLSCTEILSWKKENNNIMKDIKNVEEEESKDQ